MKTIEVKIDYKSHTETVLKNGKGDTFTFNPQKYEELQDFLSGCNESLLKQKDDDAIGFANWFKYQSKYQNEATNEVYQDYLKQK